MQDPVGGLCGLVQDEPSAAVLYTIKMKEIVDFRRAAPTVSTYKHLGLHLVNKLVALMHCTRRGREGWISLGGRDPSSSAVNSY